ncbi:LADA_0H06876g1_1 [Lachancea dasiensis]|uniref:LADA_0H06876g1_1 n=1 Tax=Lachancea dasiensis TaxID=1072105 RepID=A0A1G4K1T7_9SACH|nr:LADA_0H06876g1_1 [Lachancea dasiensis]
MDFKQDDEEFINELLGHAGLGNFNGDMGAHTTGDGDNGFERATNLDAEMGFQGLNVPAHTANDGATGNSLGNSRETMESGYLIDDHLGRQPQQLEFLSENVLFQQDPHQQDLANDDQLSSFTEDRVSSLGSSVTTGDFMSPTSSSFNYQSMQQLQPQQSHHRDSVESTSYSNYLSSSFRSPSNSLRQGNLLSGSLRTQQLHPRHSSVGSVPQHQSPLSLEQTGSSAQITPEERLRRRREFHNAVERRRRELIKQKIKELSKIVPPSLLNYNDQGKEVKPNKSVILGRSVDYLEYLQQVLEIQDRKRQLLLRKVREFELFRQHGKTSALDGNRISSAAHVPDSGSFNVGAVNSTSPEQILDNRTLPLAGDNASSTPSTTIQDDLQQFLSGDLIEAEDNAKLMFGGESDGTAADFLLNFGK